MGNLLKLTALWFGGVASGMAIGACWRVHRYQSVECKTARERSDVAEFMEKSGLVYNKKTGAWRREA